MPDPAVPTATQVRRLREQYARIAAEGPAFAAGFYARLFALAPLTRALFRQHMDAQGDRFVQMLGRLIDEADRPAVQDGTIARLAELHRPHGLVAEDVAPVQAALCAELAHRLGADFDAEAEAAWIAIYRRAVAPMFVAPDPDTADA